MGLAVLLVEGQDVPLDAEAIARLSELGITHVALVRDGDTAGLVIEGWGFDSVRSAAAAATALGVEARTFHQLLEMAVSPALNAGGTE
jgi:hypothetical protein